MRAFKQSVDKKQSRKAQDKFQGRASIFISSAIASGCHEIFSAWWGACSRHNDN
jgi:hypothetical protein